MPSRFAPIGGNPIFGQIVLKTKNAAGHFFTDLSTEESTYTALPGSRPSTAKRLQLVEKSAISSVSH
jgi:hypothetical protein